MLPLLLNLVAQSGRFHPRQWNHQSRHPISHREKCKCHTFVLETAINIYPTSYNVAKSVRCFSGVRLSVCLFVCQHDNFRGSKHKMMKLGVGGRCIGQ